MHGCCGPGPAIYSAVTLKLRSAPGSLRATSASGLADLNAISRLKSPCCAVFLLPLPPSARLLGVRCCLTGGGNMSGSKKVKASRAAASILASPVKSPGTSAYMGPNCCNRLLLLLVLVCPVRPPVSQPLSSCSSCCRAPPAATTPAVWGGCGAGVSSCKPTSLDRSDLVSLRCVLPDVQPAPSAPLASPAIQPPRAQRAATHHDVAPNCSNGT